MDASARVSRQLAVVSSCPALRDQAQRKLSSLGYHVAAGARTTDVVQVSGGAPAAILYRSESNSDASISQLRSVVREAGEIPVILLSSGLDPGIAARAARLGAADCLSGDESPARLSASIEGAVARSARIAAGVGAGLEEEEPPVMGIEEDAGGDGLLAASPSMLALKRTARRIASSDVTVLIQGESGVGKEVVARYIHRHSPAASEPFVKVNCAAIPDELLESELFGHEKGAFTGAVSAKPGKFEIAKRGTMLLDEISEMRVSIQAKLLGVLQDGEFMRLGGTRQVRCEARICSTANVHLEQAIEEGRFREDLYFRLKVIDLYVPPLRDRREDVLLLAQGFLETFAQQYRRPPLPLTEALKRKLLAHPWPGNVRELENLLRAAAVMGEVEWAMNQLEQRSPTGRQPASVGPKASTEGLSLRDVSERARAEAERAAILETLERERWNRRRAARRLDVSYKTLLKKIRLYDVVEPGERQASLVSSGAKLRS
ncbi:MAG TPA: sigma-54 dependent transcriptional regulator [Thermoanaerobaculia bacterium]|nr:sigma-54 dependent transcriptional regulator [Thermoanaerobaculia bacterium]